MSALSLLYSEHRTLISWAARSVWCQTALGRTTEAEQPYQTFIFIYLHLRETRSAIELARARKMRAGYLKTDRGARGPTTHIFFRDLGYPTQAHVFEAVPRAAPNARYTPLCRGTQRAGEPASDARCGDAACRVAPIV